jgi:F0F1-type ATP synthase assembly protein I
MSTPSNRRSSGSRDGNVRHDGQSSAEARNNPGYNAGMAVFSYMIGGIIVWSLIGWGLDNLWGTRWIVLLGALLGAAGGFYLSHMHGHTTHRSSAGESETDSDPSQDGDSNAK